MKKSHPIDQLLSVMSRLRSPTGCPWDREQDHRSLRWHAVEEVYELVDAIESGDDQELEEELGDLLLQVVFHCQLARERGSFDFNNVARHITTKLIRRHPHVFGDIKVRSVDEVWSNWDKIKHAEKRGTKHARASALDGIPKHLPALLRAEKLLKKATKAGLIGSPASERRSAVRHRLSKRELARRLFALAHGARERGWSAEELLRDESRRQERSFRNLERRRNRRRDKATQRGSARPDRGG